MFKKNNLFLGIIYGLIVPVLAWLVFAVLLKNETSYSDKPATPYLIAIG
jgi:cytochrome c oxidase subunit IV